MADSSPVHVVCSTDDGYALPTAAMVSSVADSASPGRRLTVHVLDGGMSATVAARLRRAIRHAARRAGRRGVDLRDAWHTPDPQCVAGLNTRGHLSPTTFLRLKLAELLPLDGPETIERVVWLDSDVVVRRDLAPLATASLTDPNGRATPAGAVRNAKGTIGAAIPTRTWPDPEAAYMNAGVLVIDPVAWRDEGTGEAILDDLRAHQHLYRWMDQCGANAVMNGRWAEIDEAWNTQVGSRASRSAPPSLSEAGVVHFTGPWKPWQADYAVRAATSPEAVTGLNCFRAAWLDAARASGWFSPAQWVAFRLRLALAETMSTARRGAGRAKRVALAPLHRAPRLGAKRLSTDRA